MSLDIEKNLCVLRVRAGFFWSTTITRSVATPAGAPDQTSLNCDPCFFLFRLEKNPVDLSTMI